MYNFSAPPVSTLSVQSQRCIMNLHSHQPEDADLSAFTYSRRAAVLVLLYEVEGVLRVLLTTRAKHLRAHPGQTALPGGKVEETDADVVETAYREAHEEVALPLHCPHVHTVVTLRPFFSSSRLLVTPVVALLTDSSILTQLIACTSEVACIFDHPLEALLDPGLARDEPLVPIGSEHWPYATEFHDTSDVKLAFLDDTMYRMHRFRSSASPIKGLTADILIATADIAYDRLTDYERYATGQLTGFSAISAILEAQTPEQEVSGTSTPVAVGTGPGVPTMSHAHFAA